MAQGKIQPENKKFNYFLFCINQTITVKCLSQKICKVFIFNKYIHYLFQYTQKPFMKNNLPNNIMRYLAYLDFFSSKATFKFKNKDYFSTLFGSIISIAFIIVCAIFTIANQTLWRTNYFYTSVDQSHKLNQFSIRSSDLNLALNFLNYKSAVIEDILKIEYYCYDLTQSYPIPLKSNKNCQNGQYCLSADQSCPFYFHQNYNTDQIVILIRACNMQRDPTCTINKFMQQYNNTNFQIAINYSQWAPDLSNNKLKEIPASQIISLTVSDNIITFQMPLNKIEWNQNYQIFPGLISYDKFDQKTYYDSSNKIIKNSQAKSLSNNIIGNISIVPQGTIIMIDYAAADYTQIIIYFASFLGTLALIFSICIPNYTINSFYWEVGSYLKYSFNKQNKILDPEQFSFVTFLVCLFYYKPLEKIWFWFMKKCNLDSLKARLPIIKYGDKQLNITNLLKKLIKLSKEGNLTKSNVKLTFPLEQQQDYKTDEEHNKIVEFILLKTDTNQIQKNAFLTFMKVNKVSFEEAMIIYDMLFPEKYKLMQNEVSNEILKLFKQYQNLLQLEKKIANQKLLFSNINSNFEKSNNLYLDSNLKRDQSIFIEAYSLNYIASGTLPQSAKNSQINKTQKTQQIKNIFNTSITMKHKDKSKFDRKNRNLITNLDKHIEMDEIGSQIHL